MLNFSNLHEVESQNGIFLTDATFLVRQNVTFLVRQNSKCDFKDKKIVVKK